MIFYKISDHFANIVTFCKHRKNIQVSNNKKDWIWQPCDEAMVYPWITINNSFCSQILVIDIDPKHYKEKNIKFFLKHIKPHYIIKNPQKEHSLQIGYIFDKPIWKNSFEFDHFEEIRNYINFIVNADQNFTNYKAKNPCSYYWEVEWFDHELIDYKKFLNKILSLKFKDEEDKEICFDNKAKYTNEHYIYNKDSTNCANFDHLRYLGYEWIDEYRSAYKNNKDIKIALSKFLLNQADPSIYKHQTRAEIRATVKSITKFCVDIYSSKEKGKYARINKNRRDNQMRNVEYIKKNYNIKNRFSYDECLAISNQLNVSVKSVRNYISMARSENVSEDKELELIIIYREKKCLKFKEIASILEKNIITVKSKYYRYQKSKKGNTND